MSDKRIPILTPEGKFSFIDERFGDEVVRAGGRVLTKKEAEEKQASDARQEAQAREDARYEAQSPVGKALGAASTIASAMTPGTALTFGAGASPGTAPAAYSSGVTEGLTGGLGQGLVRQGIDATLGHEAGDKYAQSVTDQKLASPIAHGAGNLVGTTAGIVAPAGTAAENIAGRGVARALGYAGVENSGTIAKAVTQAAKLGTRGAVEGGIIGGGDYVGEQLLQDHDVAADKLFSSIGTGSLYGGATGAVLGGGSSLLGSGIKAGLSRVLSREGTDLAAREAGDVAVQPASKTQSLFDNPTAGGRRLANDLAADALGATKVQMRNALENVAADQASAKAAVGEYVNRVIKDHVGENASAWQVGKVGRADDLLNIIQADKAGRIATGLSDSIKSTPARVDIRSVYMRAAQEAENMSRDPIRAAGADAFFGRVKSELDALARSGRIGADGTVDAADAFYLRSGLAKNAYEVSKVSGHAGEAYKAFLRDLDHSTISAIDEAATKAGKTGQGDEIRYWKRQWQLATAAEKMAEGGAERYLGNNTLGLREGMGGAVAMMTGHPILGAVGPYALKLAKERGKAIAAYTLSEMAERGTLAKLVGKTDEQIARASKGPITLPEKGAAKASEVMPPPRAIVPKMLARVAAFQADPDAFVDHASQQTEGIATHSPEIASGIVQRQVKAMIFLSSKVPQQGDPDPLDPRKTPEMTPTEQAQFAKYAWYTEKPERFFAEVARGKLTPEGAETAQALMPRAFEQLQQQTFDALTTQLARGNKIPFRQRQILGELLDFAATPAQRPQHRTFLQGNVSDVPPSDPMLASNQQISPAAKASSRRPMLSQSGSALDRLEANGPGRRRT